MSQVNNCVFTKESGLMDATEILAIQRLASRFCWTMFKRQTIVNNLTGSWNCLNQLFGYLIKRSSEYSESKSNFIYETS